MEDPNYEAFKKKVDGLNEKYCFWLAKHDDIITGTAPADLHNYYFIHASNGRVTFNVLHMEDFPRDIQQDLKYAFNTCYKSK